MSFLSWVLKDLANEYRMPHDRFLRIWRRIAEALGYKDKPKPRGPSI